MSLDERNQNTVDEEAGWSVSRRGLFATAAGGAAAVAAVAVMAGGASAHRPDASASRVPGGAIRATPGSGDLGIANVAAGLEVLAVATYQAALDAAGSGALPDVPPAVAEFVTTARDQHRAHLDAWNGVLTSAGRAAVADPPADLAQFVNGQFVRVTDVAGAAQLALWLEQVAADTYLFAISELESTDAINLAGSIFPIDRQHQSVLLVVLGMYPVPQTFATTELKFTGDGVVVDVAQHRTAAGQSPSSVPEIEVSRAARSTGQTTADPKALQMADMSKSYLALTRSGGASVWRAPPTG